MRVHIPTSFRPDTTGRWPTSSSSIRRRATSSVSPGAAVTTSAVAIADSGRLSWPRAWRKSCRATIPTQAPRSSTSG